MLRSIQNHPKMEQLLKKWRRGMYKKHNHITLGQPIGTAAVRHQYMYACKDSTYFSILKNVLKVNK